MQDRNFNDIAEKFAQNIYGTTKGKLRQAVLWQDLEILLSTLPSRPLQILDAGGGAGYMACKLAALGHQVLLCDLSDEMIQRAKTAALAQNVSHNMRFVQCAAQDIASYIEKPVDLVLFHAVLEWVAEPQQALQALTNCLVPGGALSLMFYNHHGLLMRNMVLGNFGYVASGMPKRKRRSLSPDHPLDPQQVYQWLDSLGLTISGKTGVRVFHDYLQNKQQQIDDFDILLALEQRYCRQEPFVSLGRYIHVMANKPLLKDVL
ncbi:tRNA uridine 5-oxyacetic acid(34) methyltransferase CmoM [Pectobacteriaceae bacterium C52]|uniref:tRNA 5-carboxymethoxyuridine methyltransferase n=1 Tax=Serratia sp. (strain ATCC 39006) TaxID=104623 RepID=A0A2I5T954_SERS3|nr:tRNA uridine 5-oxyacetic acid(34) methyltransferase CmoM [Serratia sp. ATCC 39006]AUH01105.1 tRNA uridine 5-oxyacetic acid(34) methyltransferase CmoM [Serratia sp. ATCC 39006]AUH05426.1 tRNA uridine 5-oxyacetic acid(34) methyltransferase CmoM [Serratia sp. ATCC 39006]WJV64283.1 tRNA uridine 5-oxyacetic acid(34) methyltransferase CmoM [Pectobacteriaceae bacterium C52]